MDYRKSKLSTWPSTRALQRDLAKIELGILMPAQAGALGSNHTVT